MSTRSVISTLGLCVVLTACAEPRPAPEVFARDVVAAVASGDFDRFWSLNSEVEIPLGKEKIPAPPDGLASAVSPYNELRARDEFERIVRSGRIDPSNLAELDPVVVATERERYTLEVFDARGVGVGVQMQIRIWSDGYRLLGLHPIPPGRQRDSVQVES
jgi:hypothetical protein